MSDLFQSDNTHYEPLAAKLRPRKLEDFAGQSHLLGRGGTLYEALQAGQAHSMIFWGPPGTGKTTLARMVASACDADFASISAVLSGVREIRAAIEKARLLRNQSGRKSILFVDEVHRFNKAQQDAFLPHIEDGTLIFIGATTENPSFELNNALLSRARVYVLKPLEKADLLLVLERALTDLERGLGRENFHLDAAQKHLLAEAADGDARRLLNLLEISLDLAVLDDRGERRISEQSLAQVLQGGSRRFDKGGDLFHEQISALHKAVRGSAPDAALYWLCRMLDGGCDPLYIARRLVRMASEDIGNADPRALSLTLAAWDVQERLGSPEGELALAQTVLYLACAAKSNAVYKAYKAAMGEAQTGSSHDVPLHLRNAPTGLMKEMNYGAAYHYAHDEPEAYAAGENYMPEALRDKRYYESSGRGLELKIREKLDYLRSLDMASEFRRYDDE